MLELHCAHGYLLSSFITPLEQPARPTSTAARSRTACAFRSRCSRAMRAVWPDERPMSVRISATDWVEGGVTGDDAVEIARAFIAAGADIIHVSTGQTSIDAKPVYGRMYQTPFSDRIRNEARHPDDRRRQHHRGRPGERASSPPGRADLCALARPHLTRSVLDAARRGRARLRRRSTWPRQYLTGRRQLERSLAEKGVHAMTQPRTDVLDGPPCGRHRRRARASAPRSRGARRRRRPRHADGPDGGGRSSATAQIAARQRHGARARRSSATSANPATVRARVRRGRRRDSARCRSWSTTPARPTPRVRRTSRSTRWDRMIAVNLTGTFLCTQQVLPAMLAAGAGRIVNIASTAGLKGYARARGLLRRQARRRRPDPRAGGGDGARPASPSTPSAPATPRNGHVARRRSANVMRTTGRVGRRGARAAGEALAARRR